MALTPGQNFAGYEILCELGRGGMGAVYQARQTSLQRSVALKILPPHLASEEGFVARFQSEAIAAATLNHPNIVQVYNAGEADGIEYIAMEFVEGETIQQRVKRCGRLPMTEALDIAYHVAEALKHGWETAQLIHRDVKPENILLAANGTVKLGDFGLAKFLRDGTASPTVTGIVLGSAHFMSPEQARGQRDLDFRADIYSLGCSLHYIMTGRTVFEGPDFMSVMYKQVNDTPAPLNTLLPDCPLGVQRLVMKMLSKDREHRHQSYPELIEDIVHARNEAAVWEHSDDRQRRLMSLPPSPQRGSRIAIAAAIVLVLGGVIATLQAKRSPKPQGPSSAMTLSDPSDRRDFIRKLENLPPEERIGRVMGLMRELNPGFAGKEKYTVEEDAVVELAFPSAGVRNLWPLCALQHLRVLKMAGDPATKRRTELTDISALAELPLEELDIGWTSVEDLTPISNLELHTLRVANTRVKSLVPLRTMPLVELDIAFTDVTDLSPIKGKELRTLKLNDTRVRDLDPLRNMPLRTVAFDMRLLGTESDVVLTWTQLETINGRPPRGLANRILQRPK